MKKRLKIFRTIVAATILLLVPAKIQAQWAQPAEGEGYYWGETLYRGEGSGVVTVYKEDSSAAMGRVEVNPGDWIGKDEVILIQVQPGPCSALSAGWPRVLTTNEEWDPDFGYSVETDSSDPLYHYDGAWYRFINTNCPGDHQTLNKIAAVEFGSTGEGHSISTTVLDGGGTISCNMAVPGGSNIKRAKAGDIVTVRVEPNTDYRLAGLYLLAKDDPDPIALFLHQITSDFTQSTFNPNLYDFTMPDYDAKVVAAFQEPMTPIAVSRTVTYQVKNGTWSDGTTGNRFETVKSGNHPANIPTGMIPAAGYEGGSWDSDPSSSIITENKTFTYSFIEESVAATHTLTVSADPEEGGTVSGGGEYTAGTQVAATATANEGYVFDGWYKGSERVGIFDWYILNLNEDTELVAKFRKFTSATVEIDIDAPVCGVETETPGFFPAGGYDVSTQNNRPTGTVKTAGWGEGSFGWDAFFYGWNTAPSAFQGTFKGGETYLVRGGIAPENGTIPDEVKIVVNGTELSSDRMQVLNYTGYQRVQFIAQVKAVHDLTHHAKVDATCEQDGTEEYWQCEACGKMFSDAQGQTEISAPVTIPAGHDWSMRFDWGMPAVPFGGTVTYAKPVVYLVCSRDLMHQESVPADKVTFEENRTEPKCKEDGRVVYSASADYLGVHGEDSKTVTLNKLGHDWGEWTVTKEATVEEAGERVRTCKREGCGETETEVIPKIQTFTISFNAGGGSGQMASVQVANNEDWHLPQSAFTGPSGTAFRVWSAGESEYQAGQKYTPTADVTFTARWSLAKYNGPSGIHYVEVGDSQSFTYTANKGHFYQDYDINGGVPKASFFLRFSGIDGSSPNGSDRSATEFTATFAPTYLPEGSGIEYVPQPREFLHCETMILPNIFWRDNGVGDYDYPLMDRFVVVPGRTSIDLGGIERYEIVLNPGAEVQLNPVVRNIRDQVISEENGYTIDLPVCTFRSSDEAVVTVDANGKITPVGGGEATITVSFSGNASYRAAEDVTFTVTVPFPDLVLLDDDSEATQKNHDLIQANLSEQVGKVNVRIEGRTLYRDGRWNTLCLPFSVENFTGTPLEGATVKRLGESSYDASTKTLTLNFEDADAVWAGVSYLVKWTSGENIMNPVFSGVEILSGDVTADASDCTDFIGCYSPVPLAAQDRTVLYLGGDSKLYYPSVDVPVNAFRGYFQLKDGLKAGDLPANGAKNIVLNFGNGETTGVSAVESGELTTDSWYSIDGRRLQGEPAKKGIYIKNGKKVIK